MNEIRSQLIAKVTHEIRTPLSGIVGVSELLGRTTMTDKQRRLLETMDASAHALLRLVNDMLDFSNRLGGGRARSNAIRPRSPRRERRRRIYRSGFPARATPERLRFSGSRRQFLRRSVATRQILDNLVNNAIKFTERGEITVSAKQSGGDDEKPEC